MTKTDPTLNPLVGLPNGEGLNLTFYQPTVTLGGMADVIKSYKFEAIDPIIDSVLDSIRMKDYWEIWNNCANTEQVEIVDFIKVSVDYPDNQFVDE